MGEMVTMLVLWLVVIGVMWFLLMRPQKKEQKRIQQMLASMEVGDTALTTSGFYGVIIDITDEDVIRAKAQEILDTFEIEGGGTIEKVWDIIKTVVFRCRKLRLLRLKNRMQIDFKSIILHYEIRENFEIFSKFSLIFSNSSL